MAIALQVRTHHVPVFEVGSPQIDRPLNFRDDLIAHPDVAQRYSDLKRELAQPFPEDLAGYIDAKTPFIQAIDGKAKQWRTAG